MSGMQATVQDDGTCNFNTPLSRSDTFLRTSRFPSYGRYKPSCVEWLGEIPEHWPTMKFRFLVTKSNAGEVIDRTYWGSGDELLFTCQRESLQSDYPSFPQAKRTGADDLLLTRNGTPYVHIPPPGAIYSNVVQRCTLRKGLLRTFIAHALEAACETLRGRGHGVSIPTFSYEKWLSLTLPLPDLGEQQTIAKFIATRTEKIDSLLAKKRELIERLKETRQTLISQSVVNGLPSKLAQTAGLNPHPALSSSGVNWLGDVPAHWAVKPLRHYLVRIEQGWSPDCEARLAEDGEWGVLKVGCVNYGKFDALEHKALPAATRPLPEFEVSGGDLLMSRANTAELVGSTAFVRSVRPGLLLCDKLYRLILRGIEPRYAEYFLNSAAARFQYEREATGASPSMKNIGQDTVRRLIFPIPPIEEQRAIADCLDRETERLDRTVSMACQVIERIGEYRTALITAAVAGKIDVRNTA